MSTDSEENPSYSKKSKHFFAGLGTSIPPTLNTCVDTLCKFIDFGDVEPCNIFMFGVEVSFRECIDKGVGGVRNDSSVHSVRGSNSRRNRHQRGTGNRQGWWCLRSSALYIMSESNLMMKKVTHLLVHLILEDVNIFIRGDPSF
jgi:hypothetical protein